ncbi:MAG TPA: TRAP transporter substrate-binding protein [Stellaceae bacterium]|nr:TRAP transporter substrate-binding protein [Stellaceae bacterium]
MNLVKVGLRAAVAAAVVFSYAAIHGPARAADPGPIVMKITLPTINENTHQYAKNFAAAVEKDSGGRIKPEIYPASQLGSIPRQIEGTQFGSIQVAVIPPEFFVGIDPRFEVMAAPGLVGSLPQAERLTADPEVKKLILGLGANKGLYGAALFVGNPSFLVSKMPVRTLADFKGKKLRVLASEFQIKALERLGATAVAMSLGDVLPAIQQGAIDGAVSAITVFTSMQYEDAAKYVTRTGQPTIFIAVEFSRKWHDSLPADLRKIVDEDAARESVTINAVTEQYFANGQKQWTEKGGELIDLSPDDQAAMMESMASAADEVAKKNPDVAAAYQIVTAAAKRVK